MPSLLSLNSYHYKRGGSEAVYFEHEAMFRALDWETAHMAMHHPMNLSSEWREFFVDEIEFGHSYSLFEKVAMAGKVIYSFEARRKLAALLDRFPASVAHVHGIYHHLSASVLPLLRERGVPVVLTAHDLKIACPAYKMLNRGGVCEKCKGGNLLHLIANRCVRESFGVSTLVAVESVVAKSLGLYRRNVNRVVAPSAFYRSKLLEWGWPENQVIFIPNYVDAEQHIPQYAPGNYFLYFGRLAPEKGVATLIHAAKKAGVQLKVVGTGPLEDELKALVAGSSVDMLGYRSGEALWSLVRDCRAVVLPSEWYENAPMSVLESFALGKPVIGARIGGIPEMVIEGETGYTFDSGSVDALATRLTEMAALPDAAVSAMGQRARVLVSTRYTASRYRAAMLDLYAELGAIPARLPVG